MAYLGTTAASSVSNPPVLIYGNRAIDPRIPGTGTTGSTIFMNNAYGGSTSTYQEGKEFGGQFWGYWSTDNTTAIAGAGYFTDFGQLGGRPGDVIMTVGTTGGSGTVITRFLTVASISTAGAATMSTAPIAGTT
jgi:hypothetical protein